MSFVWPDHWKKSTEQVQCIPGDYFSQQHCSKRIMSLILAFVNEQKFSVVLVLFDRTPLIQEQAV